MLEAVLAVEHRGGERAAFGRDQDEFLALAFGARVQEARRSGVVRENDDGCEQEGGGELHGRGASALIVRCENNGEECAGHVQSNDEERYRQCVSHTLRNAHEKMRHEPVPTTKTEQAT